MRRYNLAQEPHFNVKKFAIVVGNMPIAVVDNIVCFAECSSDQRWPPI